MGAGDGGGAAGRLSAGGDMGDGLGSTGAGATVCGVCDGAGTGPICSICALATGRRSRRGTTRIPANAAADAHTSTTLVQFREAADRGGAAAGTGVGAATAGGFGASNNSKMWATDAR